MVDAVCVYVKSLLGSVCLLASESEADLEPLPDVRI